MSGLFTKATKAESKARIAITGPSGAGKTYSALLWATELAEGGKIAFIDTERDSAKLYADKFDFYSLSFAPPYSPQKLIDYLDAAENEGFAVVIIDSLTHFWSGEGGILEMADRAGAKSGGNNFAGWKVVTPIQQKMIDRILSFNGHVIASMRSKTEWSVERDERGKASPKKIGLAPEQRAGIEYEFTLVLDLDIDHNTNVNKTRCPELADKLFRAGEATGAAKTFLNWLQAGEPEPERKVEIPVSTTGADSTVEQEREDLANEIKSLTPNQRRLLTDLWKGANLPKVTALNLGQIGDVQVLIDEVLASSESGGE